MKRSGPPRRSRPMARSGRIAPKKRSRDEFARVYGSEARVEWVKRQPCVVPHCQMRTCENAHVRTGGMGRKADAAAIVPLCFMCHDELHHYGIQSFEAWYGIDLTALAAETEQRWQAYRQATPARTP